MPIAPIDPAQYAQSVREDSADLASYALSDKGSTRGGSSSPARQPVLESLFPQISEGNASERDTEGLQHEIIHEVSEPVSPDDGPYSHSPGMSALTYMLKRSPPSRSPPDSHDGDNKSALSAGVEAEDSGQGRLVITSDDIGFDDTEQTPLLRKKPSFETRHPDWIRGEPDLEGQGLKRHTSWPKLRNLALWPKEKASNLAAIIFHPKRWNGKAIWRDTVVAPVGYLPAAILGTLLNILDALSYGMLSSEFFKWTLLI